MRTLLAGTALALLMGARTAFAIDVSTEAQLRNAIDTARTTPNTTINLLNGITLTTGDLPALQGTGTVINGNAIRSTATMPSVGCSPIPARCRSRT
jgi:hypothetical protein